MAAMLAFVAATGAAAADLTQSFSVGVDACDNATTEQLCTPASEVSVTTEGVLRVEFVAATSHCSDFIAHLLVDGVERFVSDPLAPGQGTGAQDLGPVTAGAHTVGVQGEGVLGGCNSGVTGSWAGTLSVVVSGDAGAGASLTPSPAAVPVDGGGTDYTPLIVGLLGVAVLGVGGFAVYQIRKPRIPLDPVGIPPNPIVPEPDSGDALRSLLDAMAREMRDLEEQMRRLQEGAFVDTASGSNLDPLSEMGEMEQLRLQTAMDRLSKQMSDASNLLKASSDTASSITQQMK
jgi:hypothetical protein